MYFKRFVDELHQVFDSRRSKREAVQNLTMLTQASRMVKDYAIDFRIYAADGKWNATAVFDAFYLVKDDLATCDHPEQSD